MSSQVTRSLKFVEQHKHLFGFADWKVSMEDKTHVESDYVASAEPEYLEHTLHITLYKKYLERTDWQETLIHELCHARIGIMQDRTRDMVDKILYYNEEECVNDITRGMMLLLGKQ